MNGFKLLKLNILILINIFRIRFKFIRPNNVIINGKVSISLNSFVRIDSKSKLVINGDLVIKSSSITIKDCKITLSSVSIVSSSLIFKESDVVIGNNAKIITSDLNIIASMFSVGDELNIISGKMSLLNSKVTFGNHFKFSKHSYFQNVINITNSKMKIGENNSIQADINCNGGDFTTNENVFLNHGSQIRCIDSINIGSNVFVSYDVIIFDNNSHSIYPDDRVKEIKNGFPNNTIQTSELKPQSKSIIIEDNCWIGMRSAILKGAHIEINSIVALGSIVTGFVPSNHLAYGNPYKIKQLEL